MKILYPLSYYPPMKGAAAINTAEIVELLAKYGHKLMILGLQKMNKNYAVDYSKKNLNSPNIELHSSSRYINFPLNLILSHYENIIKYMFKLRSQFSPDIIISQYHAFHYASVAGDYISKKIGVPHIIRSHDIFFTKENLSTTYKIFKSITYPRIFKSIVKSDAFYVVCSELKDYLLKFRKLSNIDFRVHHNGIDTDKFFPMKKQDELKNKYGCDTILIFSGSLIADIGLEDFVPILPKILETNKEIHIIFLGEGPCRSYITNYFREKKIKKQVHFLGQKEHDEIPFFINNSDIGIGRITHKKIWKYSIPVKCLEYMACKKPFISTPISDDIIKDDDVGIIIKRDFKEKDVINQFLTLIEDKNLQKKLGENGFKKIQSKFRWEDIMERFNKDLEKFRNKNDKK